MRDKFGRNTFCRCLVNLVQEGAHNSSARSPCKKITNRSQYLNSIIYMTMSKIILAYTQSIILSV